MFSVKYVLKEIMRKVKRLGIQGNSGKTQQHLCKAMLTQILKTVLGNNQNVLLVVCIPFGVIWMVPTLDLDLESLFLGMGVAQTNTGRYCGPEDPGHTAFNASFFLTA